MVTCLGHGFVYQNVMLGQFNCKKFIFPGAIMTVSKERKASQEKPTSPEAYPKYIQSSKE